MRLDVFLYENNLADTRTRAKNLVELGRVLVNGKKCTKPAFPVGDNAEITVTEDYSASLGGIKLEKAFEEFGTQMSVINKICLDLGAANGGFTETLLNNGAKKVYALDIGVCALPEKLIRDERVTVMDKTNARYIGKDDFADKIEFITGDLSFISLKYVLPAAFNVLESGNAVFLIKPQFELDKKSIPKSGVIKNEKTRLAVVNDIAAFAKGIGFSVISVIEAPHPFPNKNQEYLMLLSK